MPESGQRLVFWADHTDKLWAMDITSFILARTVEKVGNVDPTEISEATKGVIARLWQDGWFTKTEYTEAIARSESQFVEQEIAEFLRSQEEK